MLRLRGDLDIAAQDDVVSLATAALGRPEVGRSGVRRADVRTLIVDMAEVRFIDSTGIAALVRVHHACAQADADLVLRSVQPRVLKALSMTGMDGFFGVDR